MGRRLRAAGAGLVIAAVLALVAAPVAAQAVEVEWGTPQATATYGERVSFVQPATLPGGVRRVELLLESPGSLGPVVNEMPAPRQGAVELSYALDLADGHILPNTTLTARWRVIGDDGSEAVGPPVTVRYEDTRFDWRTREGDLVRVHWYEGSDAFGERALQIGEQAIRETAQLLGVTESDPVDFYVYADEGAFREALGPATRENVGGQANAEIRTLFALITPADINQPWVGTVIPHELVHLVFDTAVKNPYHFPPRWLNEGLAVYLSEGYGANQRAEVQRAVASKTLIPLDGLTGQFPTTFERFSLAYAESVAAVDYLIRTYDQAALVKLVRSYATGLTDDEAFEQAIGVDVAAFDAAWRGSLNAGEPTQFGPRPAPAGPLPPGWTTAEGSPGATLPPVHQPGGPAAPRPGEEDQSGALTLTVALLGAAVLAVAAVAIFVVRRHRAAERAQAARWAAWREERAGGTPTVVPPTPTVATPSGEPPPAAAVDDAQPDRLA